VLEVNPRYTAAVEVLELAMRHPLAFPICSLPPCGGGLGWGGGVTPHPNPPPQGGREKVLVGKAVYYAQSPLELSSFGPWDADLDCPWEAWRIPGYADIPRSGESFRPGQPVLTFFAAGSTPAAVRAKLDATARDLDARLARGDRS